MVSSEKSTGSQCLSGGRNPHPSWLRTPLFLLLFITIVLSFLLTACGDKNESGRVIKFGQAVPSGGGIVQSYVTVQLDDGSEVQAWLPQDDALWF